MHSSISHACCSCGTDFAGVGGHLVSTRTATPAVLTLPHDSSDDAEHSAARRRWCCISSATCHSPTCVIVGAMRHTCEGECDMEESQGRGCSCSCNDGGWEHRQACMYEASRPPLAGNCCLSSAPGAVAQERRAGWGVKTAHAHTTRAGGAEWHVQRDGRHRGPCWVLLRACKTCVRMRPRPLM